MSIASNIRDFKGLVPDHVTVVAVSKTKTVEEIKEAYDEGQRIFGEN